VTQGRYRPTRRSLVAALAFGAIAFEFTGDPTTYFAYFTILTNLFIGLWFLGAAFFEGRFNRMSSVRLALSVYAMVTMVVYWIFLAAHDSVHGTGLIANLVLHLVVPSATLVEDLLVPWPQVSMSALAWMLGLPLGYSIVTIARGELTGWYPYFFLNKAKMGGWPPVLRFSSLLFVAFIAGGYGWRAVIHRKATAM